MLFGMRFESNGHCMVARFLTSALAASALVMVVMFDMCVMLGNVVGCNVLKGSVKSNYCRNALREQMQKGSYIQTKNRKPRDR